MAGEEKRATDWERLAKEYQSRCEGFEKELSEMKQMAKESQDRCERAEKELAEVKKEEWIDPAVYAQLVMVNAGANEKIAKLTAELTNMTAYNEKIRLAEKRRIKHILGKDAIIQRLEEELKALKA